MDVRNTVAGSLKISTDVVAKIATLAAQEVDGVASVASGSMQSVRGPSSANTAARSCLSARKYRKM